MIKIWGRASSANVQCVMWCVAELNLPFERFDAGLSYGVNNTPEFLAMNPNGTIPTVIDGDDPPLWESAAIVRYLANRYASDSFWPKDAVARANVDRWAEWGKVSVQMSFNGPIFWKVLRAQVSRCDKELTSAVDHFENKLRIADQQLAKHEFLVGENLTLADIQFGHILFRYYELEIDRADIPNVRRYYGSLCSMKHYQDHVMIDLTELRSQTH